MIQPILINKHELKWKNLHWTSKYMACVSCPMVLLAMQKYSPASVYWMSLRVREDILICPCTTIRPSKVCKEKKCVSIPKASEVRTIPCRYPHLELKLLQWKILYLINPKVDEPKTTASLWILRGGLVNAHCAHVLLSVQYYILMHVDAWRL